MAQNHEELHNWLKCMELEQYEVLFRKNGIFSLVQCELIDDDKLNKMGIFLPGHRRRILANLPNKSDYYLAENIFFDDDDDIPSMPAPLPPPVLPPKSKVLHRKEREKLCGVPNATDSIPATTDTTLPTTTTTSRNNNNNNDNNNSGISTFTTTTTLPTTTVVKPVPRPRISRPIPKPRIRISPASIVDMEVPSLAEYEPKISPDTATTTTPQNTTAISSVAVATAPVTDTGAVTVVATTGTVATPSTGTVATPSTGTVATPSTGTVATTSTSTVATTSTGTVAIPSTGTIAIPSTGTIAIPSTGTVATPTTGTVATPSTGTVATTTAVTNSTEPHAVEAPSQEINGTTDKDALLRNKQRSRDSSGNVSNSMLFAFDPYFIKTGNGTDRSGNSKSKPNLSNDKQSNLNQSLNFKQSSSLEQSDLAMYETLWELDSKKLVKNSKECSSLKEHNNENLYKTIDKSTLNQTQSEEFDRQPPSYPPPPLPIDEAPPIPPRVNEKTKSFNIETPEIFCGQDPFKDFSSECAFFNQVAGTNSMVEDMMEFDPFGQRQGSTVPTGRLRNTFYPEVPPACQVPSAGRQQKYSEDDEDSSDDETESIANVSLPISAVAISPSGPKITPGINSTRTLPKSGYLHKQGGVQGNKGWRKRYVIFNGRDLRYYSNSKNQVSKRIIPISCMQDVQQDIKENQFKFILKTNYRNFLFSTETLQDNIMWCSTLSEAIHNYVPPANGVVEGGSMCNPDKMGQVKFEGERNKYHVAIKGSTLCYYQNYKDYLIYSPIHEIDMKLASVKELNKNKIQLSTHYCHINMVFDSPQEAKQWNIFLTNAIDAALVDLQIANKIWENNSNKFCADCGMEDPTWAAVDFGIVICLKCSGVHRDFNLVKSMTLDVKVWSTSLIELMLMIGNENANNFWEFNKNPDLVINWNTPESERKVYIENKYKSKSFLNLHHLHKNKKELNEALLKASQEDDILKTMRILFSGADINYCPPDKPNETAFQLAKKAGHRLQMEFLFRNQGAKTNLAQLESCDEIAMLTIRNSVNYEGYLYKTGISMKEGRASVVIKFRDFLRRWCLLEHSTLSYYPDKKNTVARGSIENSQMLVIQATHVDKYQHSFELSTTQNSNRIYQFAAETLEEQTKWMHAIAKVFCPYQVIYNITESVFDLAGNFYIKWHGIDWFKTWLMIVGKKLTFMNKDKKYELLDLRKTINISKINNADEHCTTCIHMNGPCFVAGFPGRTVYFQADLQHDTERLMKLIRVATTRCQRRLDDQQLTADDIPVIVDKCIKFIMTNGLQEDGVYRRSGVQSKIANLLETFKSDAHRVHLVLDYYNLHDVAGALKKFFREMEDPLLTQRLYSQLLAIAETDETETKLKWYKYSVDKLPAVNKNTLKKMVTHLWSVAQNENYNKMGVDQLAIVFGPTLMSGDSSQNNYSKTNSEITVIRELIKYHEHLFEVQAKEKEIEKKMQEASEKIEILKKQKAKTVTNSMLLHIYVGVFESLPITINVPLSMPVGELLEKISPKISLKDVEWILYEAVCGGTLERPIHSTEMIGEVLAQWSHWDESDARATRLLVKQTHLSVNLKDYFDPSKSLMAELEFSEKKATRKYWFEFCQAKLSYYKDTKGSTVASWRVEDLNIYMGVEKGRDSKCRSGFTFVVKNEKLRRSRDTPHFGKALYFPSEQDMYSWYARMMFTKYPMV